MSKENKKSKVNIVDEKLPVGKNLLYALQHVFVMVAGAIAVPLMVGGAAGEDTTFLISCALFAAGVATIIQSLGIGNFLGAKIPVLEGTSFASVTAMTAIASAAYNNGQGDGTIGLRTIAGAVIVAGVFCFLFAGIWSKMLKFFPHVVTGTVVTVIGLSLFPVGIKWISGQPTVEGFNGAAIANILLALITLVFILLFSKFFKGVLGNISVLLGLAAGTVCAVISDTVFATSFMNFDKIKEASFVGLPMPLKFGWPIFDAGAIISLVIVMLVIMTEATGNMIAVHSMAGKEIDEKNLARGLRSSGLSTAISGVFNSYPVTPFAQNVGMLGLTQVFSRFMTATAGVILFLLAFFPKFAAIFSSIPQPVLGGAGFTMFGMVAIGGIRTLGKVDYDGNKNAMIVAVSIGLSLIPTAVPSFFNQLPEAVASILHSGITIGSVSAIVLNLFFNVLLPGKSKNTEKK